MQTKIAEIRGLGDCYLLRDHKDHTMIIGRFDTQIDATDAARKQGYTHAIANWGTGGRGIKEIRNA